VAARVEPAAGALDRGADGVEVIEVVVPLEQRVAPRQILDAGAGEVVLRLHPRDDVGGLLVFEPAERILHLPAVEELFDDLGPGGRRHGRGRRLRRWRRRRRQPGAHVVVLRFDVDAGGGEREAYEGESAHAAGDSAWAPRCQRGSMSGPTRAQCGCTCPRRPYEAFSFGSSEA
jgi:hypothetical protein